MLARRGIITRRTTSQGDISSFLSSQMVHATAETPVSATVRTVMRGAITLTGERIHSSNYVAPTNFCPSTNLRNSRRRVCARGGLREWERRRRAESVPGRGLRLTVSPVSRVFQLAQAAPDTCILDTYVIHTRILYRSAKVVELHIR